MIKGKSIDTSAFGKNPRSERKQIVAANMNLTDVEAQKFWPVCGRLETMMPSVVVIHSSCQN